MPGTASPGSACGFPFFAGSLRSRASARHTAPRTAAQARPGPPPPARRGRARQIQPRRSSPPRGAAELPPSPLSLPPPAVRHPRAGGTGSEPPAEHSPGCGDLRGPRSLSPGERGEAGAALRAQLLQRSDAGSPRRAAPGRSAPAASRRPVCDEPPTLGHLLRPARLLLPRSHPPPPPPLPASLLPALPRTPRRCRSRASLGLQPRRRHGDTDSGPAAHAGQR